MRKKQLSLSPSLIRQPVLTEIFKRVGTSIVVTIGIFCLTSSIAAPSEPHVGVDMKVKMQHLSRTMEIFKSLRSNIDRSQFDLEALLEKLEYDDEAIIRFVDEQIAYQPYQGLLRGALGTLMSRAGNSLDQSVLLATLLRDAGFDARITQGRLLFRRRYGLTKLSANHTNSSRGGFRSETLCFSLRSTFHEDEIARRRNRR